MADQISDAVLDAMLEQDPKSRVACETMISTGFITLAGETTTKAKVDFQSVVRNMVKEIGYDHGDKGFDYNSCAIFTALDLQSLDIAMGVDDEEREQGAGDQGIMFGYAVDETPELMPLTISLSHRLVQNLAEIRKSGIATFLRPDSKSQVTVEYVDGKAKRVDTIVLSTQHSPDITTDALKAFIIEELIQKTIPKDWLDDRTQFLLTQQGVLFSVDLMETVD